MIGRLARLESLLLRLDSMTQPSPFVSMATSAVSLVAAAETASFAITAAAPPATAVQDPEKHKRPLSLRSPSSLVSTAAAAAAADAVQSRDDSKKEEKVVEEDGNNNIDNDDDVDDDDGEEDERKFIGEVDGSQVELMPVCSDDE